MEELDIANKMFLHANTKEGTKIPDSIRIPRPSAPRETRQGPREMSSKAEQIAFFTKR